MTPSRHDELAELLGPAALGLLTTPEQEQLDRHLAGCAACREELAALTGVAARLGDLDASAALAEPSRTADAVLSRVGRERRRAGRLQAVVAAAASVAVLLAGLVTAGTLGGSDVPLEAVAVSSSGDVQARADLVAHTWGVEIKLVAAGLEAGAPYTVQVVTAEGDVVEAGAFLGTGAKELACNLNASVLREDAASFAVLDSGGRRVLTADL
jgi:anti-sigma factor RsiW